MLADLTTFLFNLDEEIFDARRLVTDIQTYKLSDRVAYTLL